LSQFALEHDCRRHRHRAEPIIRTIDQQLQDWQRVMDVNLRGTFWASRAVGRHLLSRKAPGAIVNIASVAGIVGIPGSNGYGVSKAAIVHLTAMSR
jgi:NAD(P)-dependent dehydrogenase (short-subunit alcohol dehydrogenase family)